MTESKIKLAHRFHPRIFQNFTYIYPVISRRSGGLFIGVNLNLDKNCNFDCPYCQVNRTGDSKKQIVDLEKIENELTFIFESIDDQGICRLDMFKHLEDKDKQLKDISISGDGEPTMVIEFPLVCALLQKFQQENKFHFKLILITNATLLNRPLVVEGVKSLLQTNGEVWAKLDAGTQAWYNTVNVSNISLEQIKNNLILFGKEFEMVIQTLFFEIDNNLPSHKEVLAYCNILKELIFNQVKIKYIQLHTIIRQPTYSNCKPLESKYLQQIAQLIEEETQLTVITY